VTDLTPAAERQIRELLPHAKESGVGFSWRSVELLLAALAAARARNRNLEAAATFAAEKIEQGDTGAALSALVSRLDGKLTGWLVVTDRTDRLEAVAEAARVVVKDAARYRQDGVPQSPSARALYDALAVLEEPQ